MTEQNSYTTEAANTRNRFWGTISLASIVLLVCVYFLTVVIRQAESVTTINFIAIALFIFALAAAVVSIVLTVRHHQETGIKVTIFALYSIGIVVSLLFVGRTFSASLSILVVCLTAIRWLLNRKSWRQYLALTATVMIAMWIIEWIRPPWRLQVAAAKVGPFAGVAFGIILVVLWVSQSQDTFNRHLRLKIMVWTGAILTILSVLLVTYSVFVFRQTAIEKAEASTLQQAAAEAGQIRVEAEVPLDTARALAQALTAIKDPSANLSLSRSQVNALLRQVLIENPSFLGTYTLWEPNAFDGQDDLYRGTENHDDTGRFIPYWVRDGENISIIPLEQYETPGIGDWYLLPRQSKKEVTVAPLVYPIQGVDTVMASFVVPIIYDGQFFGIAGVDAPISFTQEIVDRVDLYNGMADAILLTGDGTLISVRNRPELVNQPATEIYSDFSDLQARIGESVSFISPSPDGQYLRVFTPVDLGKTGSPWSFSLIIPVSEITAESTRTAFIQAGISLAVILLALYALWLLTGQVVRPLQALTSVASQISQGDLDATADIHSKDETGILANTFNIMVNQLKELLGSLERRVAERTSSLELAATVGRTISQVSDLDSMLRQATQLILEQFDLYYVQVYLTDSGQTTLKLQAGTGEVGVQLRDRNHSLPMNAASINGRAAIEKRAIVITDTTQSLTFRPNPLLPETRGEMALPLVVGDKVVGVLDLQSRQPGKLTEELVPAYEALAGQLAIAIQNASLLAEAEQARAEMEAQARRQVRANWDEHLDAIHKPEQIGYLYDRNQVLPLEDGSEPPNEEKAVSVPISLTGEELGSLMVEIDDEARKEQTSELLTIVARQVAQQIENLRLLESAERFRREAEQVARRQTREGWQEYLNSRTSDQISYLYDLTEVRPYINGKEDNPDLALPLKVRDEAIGRLAVQGISPEDDDAVELAKAVAERLSQHIESLRQYDQAQSALSQSEKLFDASRRLTQATDIQDLVAATVETLNIPVVNRALLTTFDYDAEGNIEQLTVIGNWWSGTGHEVTPIGTRYPLEVIRAMPMFVSSTPVFFNDAFQDERVDATTMKLVKNLNLRAVGVLPLHTASGQLGALILEAEAPHNFTPDETRLFISLAPQISTVVENRQQFERAQHQAQREAMLNAINQKIQSATSVEAVLQIAARELGHALGAPMTVAQLSVKDRN